MADEKKTPVKELNDDEVAGASGGVTPTVMGGKTGVVPWLAAIVNFFGGGKKPNETQDEPAGGVKFSFHCAKCNRDYFSSLTTVTCVKCGAVLTPTPPSGDPTHTL